MKPSPLFAEYHKLVFRPPKHFETTDDSVNDITTYLFNIPFSMFENKSSGKSRQFREVLTYNRYIDVEFKNSREYGRCLDRIVIQGAAFDSMPFSTEVIERYLERNNFSIIEIHSKVDIPRSMVTFQTIKDHFVSHAYVAPGCKQVAPVTDPSNDYAETYYAGKRTTHGKRVAFYEADKVHEDLPDTIRMELQLFGREAAKFFSYIRFDDGPEPDLTEKTFGIITGHIEFKALTGHENRSRRNTAPWWQDIISNHCKLHLPRTLRNPPDIHRQHDALKRLFYEKRQKLGEDSFIEVIASFAREMGLVQRLVSKMPALTCHMHII